MNSKVKYSLFLTSALLIVLPVLGTVNATPAQHGSCNSALVADGSPGPPPTPHPDLQSKPEPVLVADGSPGPPPTPHGSFQPKPEPLLVADGSPGPPPTPHRSMLPAFELNAA